MICHLVLEHTEGKIFINIYYIIDISLYIDYIILNSAEIQTMLFSLSYVRP